MQYHAIPCKTMWYHAIQCNTMWYHAIPCKTMQYHAIPCNTMQYHAILYNIMQYHAIPCIINNCWRSVPLPCWQCNGHVYIIYNIIIFTQFPKVLKSSWHLKSLFNLLSTFNLQTFPKYCSIYIYMIYQISWFVSTI